MRLRPRRRAYALMMVLISLVLFLALWGVVYRQTAAALRIESVQAQRLQRDEGSLQALALAVTALETGTPPSNPYTASITIQTSTGPSTFTATFASAVLNEWTVQVAPALPGDTSPVLPSSFGP